MTSWLEIESWFRYLTSGAQNLHLSQTKKINYYIIRIHLIPESHVAIYVPPCATPSSRADPEQVILKSGVYLFEIWTGRPHCYKNCQHGSKDTTI